MDQLVDLCRITALSEKFRIAITNIIRDFCTNEDVSEFIFPSTLSNEQRKYVHEKCKRMGLLTKSLGREPNRKLHMSKQTKLYCKTFYLFHHESSYQSCASYLKQYRESLHQINDQGATAFFNNKMFGRLNCGGTVTVNEPVTSKFDSFRKNLPIWAKKEEFLNLLHFNQVVIITSETGSGKSTQIPQFILEDLCTKRTQGKIICTQPRRISTVAVAERVSEERGESLGGTVGYQIKLKYVCSPQSALIYCTNGILLKTLMSYKNQEYLMNISHIIVDEIHERDKYTDFLLIALKQNLDHYPHLKIILMSATADVDLFASYFNGAQILHVPGRNHSITQLFLEDILSCINQNNSQGTTSHFIGPTSTPPTTQDLMYEFDLMNEVVSNCMETGDDSYFEQLLHLILSENSNVNHETTKGYTPLMAAAAHGRLDVVEQLLNLGGNVALKSYWEGFTAVDWAWHYAKFEVHHMLQAYESLLSENKACDDQSAALLEMYDRSTSDDVIDFNLIVKIIEYIHLNDNRGTILIFLPGYEDIIMCQDAILLSKLLNADEFELFLLHGSMNINVQQGVFKTIRHKHKVILSTNVAETSLTISDVVYVIDTGRAKEKSYDSISGTCSLQKIWISKANVKQRAGRAGRTCPGICFHMFSKRRYFSLLDNQIPEMLRVPLHEVCLQTKYLAPSGVSIAQYLKLALEPPSPMSVEMSIQNLKTLNALDNNEELTVLGQHLIQLSIDPKLGKMLIYAIVFRCLDPVLTIVSCLAYRDPFIIPLQSNLKQLSIKKQKELGGDYLSDHLILLRVFQLWQEARSSQSKKEVTEEYFISWSAMEIIYATRSQLLSHLRGMGFISMNKPFTLHDLNINSNNWPIVKGALTAGSYPNIAFNVNRHYATKNEKKVVFNKCSILNNLHPHTNRSTDYCIIYEELSKTGQHCSIRYGTVITPITVALMCGKEEIKEDNSLVIDDWLNFQQSNEILTEYRLALHEIVNKKISYPEYTFNDVENSILKIVSKMLSDEEKMCQLAQPNDIGIIPKCFPVFSKTIHNHHKRANHTTDISNVVLNRLNITTPSASRSRSVQSAPENVSGINWNCKINEKSEVVVENKSDKLLKALIPTSSYINGCKSTQDILPLHSLELPVNTAFFIVKPPNYECLQKGISSSSWIFAPQSERKIFKCFVQGFYIILFFNILKTTEFQGFARLLSTNGGDTTHPCSIQWLSTTIVSFDIISQRNLRNPYNNNNLLFKCRDGQSVELNVGKQLCTLFLEQVSMCEKVNRRPILGSIRNY